jgi:hypothetical protein
LSQAEAEKWEARMYTRALKMQLAAQRFLRGEFPPFPPDTYLAVLQVGLIYLGPYLSTYLSTYLSPYLATI